MKALQIIESAYRGTLEEQDDTIIWLTHAMKGVGADISVLLCSNAVNYILPNQDPPLLTFGKWVQTRKTDIEGNLVKLIENGVDVYVVNDDLKSRGLENKNHIDGVIPINRDKIPSLMDQFSCVWHW